MGSPSHRTRIIVVGLAGVVGAAGGALGGFYIAQVFMKPARFGENVVARLLEFMADLVIAGWAAAAGSIFGWLVAPPALRALLRWPGQGKSFACQLIGGVILWPALLLIALVTVDLPSGFTVGLLLLTVFGVSALAEWLAIRPGVHRVSTRNI